MQILIELLQIGCFRLPEGIDASCKNIIPGHLVLGLCKSIIIECLVLCGFRAGHSLDLSRDPARSERFPDVSLGNITCASLSAWSPGGPSLCATAKTAQNSDADVHLLYRASKGCQRADTKREQCDKGD